MMADVEIKYKGVTRATMTASGAKTVKTGGKWVEGDIVVEYEKPAGPQPSGTKQINIVENGTSLHDVAGYAYAEITAAVSAGGGGVEGSTFTPSNGTRSMSLTVTKRCSNIVVFALASFAGGNGSSLVQGFYTSDTFSGAAYATNGAGLRTNGSGTALAFMAAGDFSASFGSNNIDLTINIYNFAPTTYAWFAW